jgi:hypothetical protein
MNLLAVFTMVLGLTAAWYHKKLIIEYLEPFARLEHSCVIITPPGMGKTALVIATCIYIFILNPNAHIIVLSNADSLASMIVRNVLWALQSEGVQAVRNFTFKKAGETEFTISGNDGRPSCLSSGTRSVLVGARATHLIVDDGIKDQDQALSATMEKIWSNFTQVAESRIVAGGQVLIVGTRWGLNDLIGRTVRRAQKHPEARQFKVVNLALTNTTGRDSYEFDTREGGDFQ